MKRTALLEELFEDIACIGRQVMPFVPPKSSGKIPTRAQIGILFCVLHIGPQSVKELAHRLGMTPSAITQMVNGLVEEGLLIRKEDREDRRKICVTLTPKGKKKLNTMKQARMQSFTQVFKTLSDADLLQLKNIYSKIIAQLT